MVCDKDNIGSAKSIINKHFIIISASKPAFMNLTRHMPNARQLMHKSRLIAGKRQKTPHPVTDGGEEFLYFKTFQSRGGSFKDPSVR